MLYDASIKQDPGTSKNYLKLSMFLPLTELNIDVTTTKYYTGKTKEFKLTPKRFDEFTLLRFHSPLFSLSMKRGKIIGANPIIIDQTTIENTV